MLSTRILHAVRAPMRGFSLIEMMIAMVIGLFVIGSVLGMLLAINQSNSETIQSTRLTQELRAITAVIADDIKRSRRIDDPIGMVGQGLTSNCATTPVTPSQPCYPVRPKLPTASATCATYGYTGTPGNASIYNYRSVRRQVTGGVGAVVLDQLTFDPVGAAAGTPLPTTAVITNCATQMTGSTETTLSAPQIDITGLTFTPVGTNEIDILVKGRLIAGDTYTKAIERTFIQPVFMRSVAIQ